MTRQTATRTPPRRIAVLIAVACSGAASTPCLGELSFGLGADVEYTNNSTRQPADGQSDTVRTIFAGMVYRDRTANSETRVRAGGEVRDYRNDTFGDETLGNADAYAQWTMSPQRAFWVLEDRYQQVVVNPLLADTPANRENANVISTGPDLTFRLSNVQALEMGARYGQIRVSNVNVDNDRQAASARWRYDTNPRTSLSLNYEAINVQFQDNLSNTDYRRHNYFFQFETRPARSTITFDVGGTTIDRDGFEKLDGSMARLQWNRQISSDTRFGLSGATGYSDAGAEFSPTGQASDLVFQQSGGVATSSDLFYSKRLDAVYARVGVYGWSLSGYARELDYEILTQDREEYGARFDFTITPSPRLSWAFYAGFSNTEFMDVGREDEETEIGLRYTRNLGRGYVLVLQGQRIRYLSTDATQNFVEDRALVSFMYRTSSLFVR